jgi:hypothetical protein
MNADDVGIQWVQILTKQELIYYMEKIMDNKTHLNADDIQNKKAYQG